MAKHNLRVEVHASHDHVPLPDDQAMLLYQSVRELLLNVVKHAHADHARVSVSFSEDETLTLSVQDEGLGFDAGLFRAKAGGQHFGLLSVMERMEAMGGSFEVDSGPRQGDDDHARIVAQAHRGIGALVCCSEQAHHTDRSGMWCPSSPTCR